VNAGVDGETSERIKLRLQPLLQQFPDPVAVILFAGSNDNISMDSTQMQVTPIANKSSLSDNV
jgi:lysophospholipase L1-like esterase